jgi:MerR family transcriptional regulator, copper efflux regulator
VTVPRRAGSTLGVVGTNAESTGPPIACTLEEKAVPARLDAWRATLAHAQSRSSAADGALRIEFGREVGLTELAGLVEAEQHCCAFLSFTLTADSEGVALEVRAPDGAGEFALALFGSSD